MHRQGQGAHRPYEFGVKVSVATTLKHCKGGQFVTDVKALPGNPYDGHTLATVIADMEALVGSTIGRFLADKGWPNFGERRISVEFLERHAQQFAN